MGGRPELDIAGLKWGRMTVERRLGPTGGKGVAWLARCACGAVVIKGAGLFRYSAEHDINRSCGCEMRELAAQAATTHGMSNHPMYRTWQGMRDRCTNEKADAYADYGGRGVRVCDRWMNSFEAFLQDMGPTYRDGLTLDRIENDGDYELLNCRWATQQEQTNNTRSNVHIDTPRGRMTIAEAARSYGVNYATLRSRLTRQKWSVPTALGLDDASRRRQRA